MKQIIAKKYNLSFISPIAKDIGLVKKVGEAGYLEVGLKEDRCFWSEGKLSINQVETEEQDRGHGGWGKSDFRFTSCFIKKMWRLSANYGQ